jgi:hypothetical protein
VKGKLVLSYGSLGATMRAAVQERGAAGVLWYPSPFRPGNASTRRHDLPRARSRWMSISSDDASVEGGRVADVAFVLSLPRARSYRRSSRARRNR